MNDSAIVPEPFEPTKYLRHFTRRQKQPDGSYKSIDVPYLDVRYRIQWFQSEHPEGRVFTEPLVLNEETAIIRATVTIQRGDAEASATGIGYCAKSAWDRYPEKAETAAIGRALAVLGFGTQFATELDEGEQLADAPVEPPSRPAPKRQPPKLAAGKAIDSEGFDRKPPAETGELATERQVKAIFGIAKGVGFQDADEIIAYGIGIIGREVEKVTEFTKAEASTLIKSLQEFE